MSNKQVRILQAHETGHLELTQDIDTAVATVFSEIRDRRMWVTVGDTPFFPKAKFSGTPEDEETLEKDRMNFKDLILSNFKTTETGEDISPILSLNGELVGGK